MISIGCCTHAIHSTTPDTSLIEHLKRSTVSLVSVSPEFGVGAYCSGVWINKKEIATARHCVTNRDGEVTLGEMVKYTQQIDHDYEWPVSKDEVVYVAKVSFFTEKSDIAILTSINDVDHGIVRISKKPITIGMTAHVMGHPTGLQWTYLTGMVSAVRTMTIYHWDYPLKTIHINASIRRGHSGCGAFDSGGNLIGIASFGIGPETSDMSFFIHRDTLIALLDGNDIRYY